MSRVTVAPHTPALAADFNAVSDQSVMSFATAAARTAAIPTPTEGMHTYRADADLLEFWNGTAWIPLGVPYTLTQQWGSVSYAWAAVASTAAPGSTITKTIPAGYRVIASATFNCTIPASGQLNMTLQEDTTSTTVDLSVTGAAGNNHVHLSGEFTFPAAASRTFKCVCQGLVGAPSIQGFGLYAPRTTLLVLPASTLP